MDNDTIGLRLRRLRRDRALTQEELAEQASVSVAVIQKLEQGRRGSARAGTLISLANALDVDLSELVGRRPQLERGDDVRVLALRDALLSPEHLVEADPAETATPVADLREEIVAAWRAYWSGQFSRLAALLPALVSSARATSGLAGAEAAPLLAQAYQLTACLLVHLGKDDLAALGAERAVSAAAAGDDELQWATVHGTYAWTLLHQGRTEAAERHAMWAANRIEPSLRQATLAHLTVWGGLVLWALAAAVEGGRREAAVDYIGLARSAAGRFERDRHDYNSNFGPTQVAMQATFAHAVLREPGKALEAAAGVQREDLFAISYGRHLIDVAQAHMDNGDLQVAQDALVEANSLSSEWFRHQGPARSLVSDLVQEAKRLSPTLRYLARSAGVEG